MLRRLGIVFSIKELRNKIVLTAVLLAVYRMGFLLPLPFVDQEALADRLLQQSGGFGDLLQAATVFAASDIGSATVFGLGIMPYISASILFQLLAQVYPPLEILQKEGEAGRRKINEYTRYFAVVLCAIQSFVYLRSYLDISAEGRSLSLEICAGLYWQLTGTIVMTAGSCILMWIGEQIDAYGIGNGISLLIMIGIVSRIPTSVGSGINELLRDGLRIGTEHGVEVYVALLVLLVALIASVVLTSQAQRRIPVQSAKHQHRGSNAVQTIPLKLNQSGVMPIIFASSLLMFPYFALQQVSLYTNHWMVEVVRDGFVAGRGIVYTGLFVVLIFFFSYFWTALSFNPKQLAESLRDHGSFVLGYRPGKRTESYLEYVVTRVTFGGAIVLSVIAVMPNIVSASLGVSGSAAGFYGGTGLLIVVSVVLDLFQKIDAFLVSRNYQEFVESSS